MPRFASLALCLLLSTPVLGSAAAAAPAPSAPAAVAARPVVDAAPGDFARLVDIGNGRRLFLECRGKGSPAVILESGFRSRADVWSDPALLAKGAVGGPVLPTLARSTRVCAYDRPGTATVRAGRLLPSRSDPTPMPRTARALVTDLHALLRAAEVPGPYVLVGHSLGGLLVRLYASTYPREVAGVVLVDAFSERVRAHMPPAQWRAFSRFALEAPPPLDRYRGLEKVDFDLAANQMAKAAAVSPMRPIPMVVLSKSRPFGFPNDEGFSPAAVERAWSRAQRELPRLVPCSDRVVARSSHYIQLERPRLVSRSILRVVGAVRGGGHCPLATGTAPTGTRPTAEPVSRLPATR